MRLTPPPPSGSEPPREPFTADFSEGLETGLYLALLELVDEGIIITGDETMIDANSAACRLLERDYRHLVGKPLSSLFPNERSFLDARERLLIQGEMRGGIRVSLPGGRTRDMRFIAAARLRPGLHALILSPDIVAEAYAGSEAPAEDRVWSRLAAALEQALIVLDEHGRIQAMNRPAHRALDHNGDITGQRLEDVIPLSWSTPQEPPQVRLHATALREELTARVLPGPRPGWRLLLMPALGAARSAAPLSDDVPTEHSPPSALRLKEYPVMDVRNGIRVATQIITDMPTATKITEASSVRAQSAHDQQLIAAAVQQPLRHAPFCLSLEGALDHALIDTLSQALQRSDLPANLIELGFRATALHEAPATALEALRALGVRIALEDAGKDPLPLSELVRGGIDVLKLSPALVTALTHDEHGEVMIDTLARLAGDFRLEIRAAGITTAAQSDFLAALGIPLQQGPLFTARTA